MTPLANATTSSLPHRLLAVVACLVLVASGCTSDDGDPVEALAVEIGQLAHLTDEGRWVVTEWLVGGERVRTEELTRLTGGEDTLWLLPDTEVTLADGVVEVHRGDAVVEGDRLGLLVGDAEVDGVGAVRVEAGSPPRVVVYAGSALVRRPGERYQLQEYRELRLTSRRFDGVDDPLSYERDDPIDQRLLARAIAFDDEVARYRTRLGELYGTGLQPPTFYASFGGIDADDIDTLTTAAPSQDELGAVGPAAEALVTLFVAQAVAGGDPAQLPQAVERVAALRAEGARWGLIALVLDVRDVVLGEVVDEAVAAREVVEATLPPPPPPPPASASPPAPAPAPNDGSPAPAPVLPPPAAAPGPPPEAPTVEPDSGVLEPLDPALDPVGDLLGEVLDVVPDLLGG